MENITGTSRQRTYQIIINCPDDNDMNMTLFNQEVLEFENRTVYNNLGCMPNIRFNKDNPLHVQLSEVLHAIDTEERAKNE